ncbi:hypothetical protein G9A89_007587 [Geosiphon pyriformis]|nr:hypothetical protein G9A89_007587 [Geosiphon pyriformis]
MNNLNKQALKQVQSLQTDLEKFEREEDLSVGLQGQVSASFTALKRTIDDYDAMAKKEIILVKQEKANANVNNLRSEYNSLKEQFDKLKQREQNKKVKNNRTELLGRRHNTATPEYPFQHAAINNSSQEHVFRENEFLNETDNKLDEYIAHGREILNNIYDQNNVLKSAQRRMLDVANTLGLSRSVIQYIERRSAIATCVIVNVKGFPDFGRSNTMFQFLNRCVIASLALVLIFAELGWPKKLYFWLPMLDDSHSWTFFGFLQIIMGSLILGYDSGISSKVFLGHSLYVFIVVPGYFIFIIGILYLVIGCFGGVGIKKARRFSGESNEKSQPPGYSV